MPRVEQLQQCALVDRKLLQRLTLDARHDAGNEPARQTHFDHCDQCAVLFQDDTGLVQVVRLLHWGPPSVTSATMYTISSPPPHSISKRAMWELTWRFYRESWHCLGADLAFLQGKLALLGKRATGTQRSHRGSDDGTYTTRIGATRETPSRGLERETNRRPVKVRPGAAGSRMGS